MDIRFNIFISHDSNDQVIAIHLKSFLENIFLNLNVYVSGNDLQGGQTWIENIKIALKSSQVIIALITSRSINSTWLHFESGAGFLDDRTIPLVVDGIDFVKISPPLGLLHARRLDEKGIGLLIVDICKKLSLRKPTNLPGLSETVANINEWMGTFKKATAVNAKRMSDLEGPVENVTVTKSTNFDPEILTDYQGLLVRAKGLLREKIMSVADRYELPSVDELQKMNLVELSSVASAYNIPSPVFMTSIYVSNRFSSLPKSTDPEWKKVTFRNKLNRAFEELDRYEGKR